ADLFSLGCVLYRLCTGRLPWKRHDALETMIAVATEAPIPAQELNPDLPPKLAQLVMQLLAKKPEERPATARAVVEALQAIERERPSKPAALALPVAVPVPSNRLAAAGKAARPNETGRSESALPVGDWHAPTEALGTVVPRRTYARRPRRR